MFLGSVFVDMVRIYTQTSPWPEAGNMFRNVSYTFLFHVLASRTLENSRIVYPVNAVVLSFRDERLSVASSACLAVNV
jgi:hypothetical protein